MQFHFQKIKNLITCSLRDQPGHQVCHLVIYGHLVPKGSQKVTSKNLMQAWPVLLHSTKWPTSEHLSWQKTFFQNLPKLPIGTIFHWKNMEMFLLRFTSVFQEKKLKELWKILEKFLDYIMVTIFSWKLLSLPKLSPTVSPRRFPF